MKPWNLLLLALAVGGVAPIEVDQGPGGPGPAASPAALLDRLESSWNAKDSPGYLALWRFPTEDLRALEGEFARERFASEETQLRIERPSALRAESRLRASGSVFSVIEPRGRVEQCVFVLERGRDGWSVVAREPAGQVEGLVHLSLDPAGFRADGLTLKFEDFEIQMKEGTLFTSPASVGPTVLVFAGEASVRLRPGPPTEQEQLRQFSGEPELVDRVRAVFVRIHPAALRRVLEPVRFEPDPAAAARWPAAARFYREHVERAFVLDGALPRSPWWLIPGVADAAVTFETRHNGTLTFALSGSENEGASLFDRAKRRQICLYPLGGGDTNYNEDAGRAADVLHHDLSVRFDPDRQYLEGEDTLRIRLESSAPTLRLRLDEGLRVLSITSAEAGRLLFFRVRGQDALMVSLGDLAGADREIALTVRYDGVLRPGPADRELLQAPDREEDEIQIENVLVYTNRTAWYPQAGPDDYALATLRFEVPVGFTAVTGGVRTSARVVGERTIVEYRQDQPGKYIAVAVGRLLEAGSLKDGALALQAFAVARIRRQAPEMLQTAADVLRFFAEEFGPCPYSSLNMVLIEGQTPGGHSPPGMILISQRPPLSRGLLRDDPANFSDVPGFFLAHELAHQWWGHGVAGQNYHERWLSEAVAQYAAALWVRRTQGDDVFRSILRRMASWALKWTREGPISLGFRLGHIKQDAQIFRAIVYDKGAYVLHMIRAITGEAAFHRALAVFQAEHRFAKAGTEAFRQALEDASGTDLGPYFREWVFGTSVPTLRVSHRTEEGMGGFRTVVRVEAENLPGAVPLLIEVSHGRGKEERRVTLPASGGAFTIDTPTRPRRVEVNRDGSLLVRVRKP